MRAQSEISPMTLFLRFHVEQMQVLTSELRFFRSPNRTNFRGNQPGYYLTNPPQILRLTI